MSATVGYGVGAKINLAPELTYRTAADPATGVWLPFTAESVKGARPSTKSGTITGSLSVQQILPGRRSGGGDISHEVDGSAFGLMFNYFNGSASGAYTKAAVPSLTAAPTLTPAVGGTNAVGTYYGCVTLVWSKISDGSLWIMGKSAESASGTTDSTNKKLTWAWGDPTVLTPPEGFALGGTALWRTAAGGAAGSETFLHYQAGTANTYTDVGSGYVGTGTSAPPSGTVYEHVFLPAFTPGANPLPSFTTTIVHDNDKSIQHLGCRMTGMDLAVGAGNEIVTSKFSLLAADWQTESNPTSSAISNIRKMMSWQSGAAVNGVATEVIESYSIAGKMAAGLVSGLSGKPRYRDVGYGEKSYEIGFNRGFESNDFVDYLNAGNPFGVNLAGCGQPFELNKSFVYNGETAYPFRYAMTIDVPALTLSEAGGNAGGMARIMEPLKATAQTDATTGYDLRLKLYNLTSTY